MNRLTTRYIYAVVIVSLASLCVASAQVATKSGAGWQRSAPSDARLNSMTLTPVVQKTATNDPELHPTVSPKVPFAPPTPKLVEQIQEEGVGTLIGTTYYDFQTNSSMSNRVTYFSESGDKLIQMLWMANSDATRDGTTRVPGFNQNRGSKYNFINVGDPDNLVAGIANWKRMETERGGWPSPVQFDDGSLGSPTHTPVKFYRNGAASDDNWQKSASDPTTASDSAVWARAAIDNLNNIHLIYNRSVPDAPGSSVRVNQVCYRRSTGSGDSWEPEIFFTGPNQPGPADRPSDGEGGDTYAIAARGSRVSVIMYANYRVILYQSQDHGETWSRRTGAVFAANATPIDTTMEADTTVVHTDTVMGPLANMDVIIDHAGITHFVVGYCPQFFQYRTYPSGQGRSTIFLLDGTLNSGSSTNQKDLRYSGLAYGNTVDTSYIYRMGPVGGGSWDGNGYIVNIRPSESASRWPQLGVDTSGSVYCLYGSMKNGDVLSIVTDTTNGNQSLQPDTLVTVDGLQMHVYGTQMYKPANGYNILDIVWSAPKDLSLMGKNSQYASLCDDVADGRLYYVYSSTATPGDRVSNVEMDVELASVYARALPTTALNVPVVHVDEEKNGLLRADVALSPNPSDDASRITISGVTNGTILVSLASSLGEIVMQTSTQPFGERAEILIPTRGLASGAYTVTIQQNGRRITKTLSVIH